MAIIDTARPTSTSTRTLRETVTSWLDSYTLWAMNSAETLAAREHLLDQQWTRSNEQRTRATDEDAVAREMAR